MSFVHPRKLVSFVPWYVTCFPLNRNTYLSWEVEQYYMPKQGHQSTSDHFLDNNSIVVNKKIFPLTCNSIITNAL